jgi:hypothetical protein
MHASRGSALVVVTPIWRRAGRFADRWETSRGPLRLRQELAIANVTLVLVLWCGAGVASSFCGDMPFVDGGGALRSSLPSLIVFAGAIATGVAAVLSAAQLVPGGVGWRRLRSRLGVLNLLFVWPLAVAFVVAFLVSLPAGASCLFGS